MSKLIGSFNHPVHGMYYLFLMDHAMVSAKQNIMENMAYGVLMPLSVHCLKPRVCNSL